jgi:hypothetical protein
MCANLIPRHTYYELSVLAKKIRCDTQEEALGGFVVANASDETSVGALKLEEAIEMPYSDLSVIHRRKCTHGRMEIFLVADGWQNHYIWGMCTTSAKCKTIITDMLMVKSGMNPHKISWATSWFRNVLVWGGYG